ncbi:MAG: zinc ribbon domain-containing protein [Clostridium sp.]
MNCNNCKSNIKEDSKFCTICGSKVEIELESYNHLEVKNKKNTWIITMISVVIVICIACGGGFYLYQINYKKPKEKEEVTVNKTNKPSQPKENEVNDGQATQINIYDDTKDSTKEERNVVSKLVSDEIDTLIRGYLDNFAFAANSYNFASISTYMKHNSAIYNTQKKLLNTYKEKGITIHKNYYDIVDIKKNNNTYTVSVKESFEIYKPDSTSTAEYISEYKVVKENNKFYMTEISTK